MAAVAYENIGMHLRRRFVMEEHSFVQQIIEEGRGGWCYQRNGLLTAVLQKIGFKVTRVGSCIKRDTLGEDAFGDHLIGLVDLDKRYVVDAGLGLGPVDPYPLEEREWQEGGFHFRLERLDERWWRFHNHEDWIGHDFTEEPRELGWFKNQCCRLQDDETSYFRNNAIVVSWSPDSGFQVLAEDRHSRHHNGTSARRQIQTEEDYANTLTGLLGKSLGSGIITLWTGVRARSVAREQSET